LFKLFQKLQPKEQPLPARLLSVGTRGKEELDCPSCGSGYSSLYFGDGYIFCTFCTATHFFKDKYISAFHKLANCGNDCTLFYGAKK
jgi:hypothetical protein